MQPRVVLAGGIDAALDFLRPIAGARAHEPGCVRWNQIPQKLGRLAAEAIHHHSPPLGGAILIQGCVAYFPGLRIKAYILQSLYSSRNRLRWKGPLFSASCPIVGLGGFQSSGDQVDFDCRRHYPEF